MPIPILIAEDDPISRAVLERTLRAWGHDLVVVADGTGAWNALQRADSPRLAILDWEMPGLEGPEVCRLMRTLVRPVSTYTILLTVRDRTHDVVTGLDSGADDYLTKPFDRAELRARISVGERVLGLQQKLVDRVHDLEDSLARVRQLQGLLPVCAWCRKVRNDHDYWQSVEEYVAERSDLKLTHGICPVCLARECGHGTPG